MAQTEYFKFVEALAADLNRQEVKLSSFPDVVMRIRRALDDPDTSSVQLATILGVDPVLASRILILANSAHHNPTGTKIENLDAAIGRVGFEQIRTAAITYAVEQLHGSKGLEPLKNELRQTWSAGLRLAVCSEVVAGQCTGFDADNAFLAGLLHRIGVLYIFSKYADYPGLLQDPEARRGLIDEWAAPIGESIVTNWGFSEEIEETLNPDEVETTHRRTEPNLADVVSAAKSLCIGNELEFCESNEATRLQLSDEMMPEIRELYKQRMDSLASSVR